VDGKIGFEVCWFIKLGILKELNNIYFAFPFCKHRKPSWL
jgi:hypothetical protein